MQLNSYAPQFKMDTHARRVRRRAELASGFGSDTDTSATESSGEDVIVVHGSDEGSEGV